MLRLPFVVFGGQGQPDAAQSVVDAGRLEYGAGADGG